MSTDILLLSLGTTRGLRIADAELAGMLAHAGATVRVSGVRIGAGDRLRRGYPVNDVVESVACARALTAAVTRERPRAVIFSTTTAALLAAAPVPYGVWFDSPAALNRPGRRNRALHALERTSFSGAEVLMPWSPQDVGFAAKTVCVAPPVPVLAGGAAGAAGALGALGAADAAGALGAAGAVGAADAAGAAGEREPLVVAYTPDPKAKDLELAIRAWEALISGSFASNTAHTWVSRKAPRLVITGIESEWAREFLRRRGITELPPGVELAGMVSQPRFAALLLAARVFLSSAAWEDFGLAPLEALGAGAALCAAPAGGPFPALALARELDPRFVSADRAPASLAAALSCALSSGASASYRAAASAALAGYQREQTVTRLAEQVLPRLL